MDTTYTERGIPALDANDKFRALVEQLPAITYVVRVADNGEPGSTSPTLYISPQVETILGFTPVEWLSDPEHWMRQLHPRDRDRMLQAVRISNQNKTDFSFEYRAIRKDGRYVTLFNTARYLTGADGALYAEGLMFDITRQKRNALRDQLIVECIDRLHQVHDLPKVGAWLRDRLDEIMPATHLVIAMADPASGQMFYPAPNNEQASSDGPDAAFMQSLIDHVLTTRKSLHWLDADTRALFDANVIAQPDTMPVDWAGLPLQYDHRTVGVLAVYSNIPNLFYSPDDISLLHSMANALSHGLREIDLQESVQRRLVHEELLALISTKAIRVEDPNAFLNDSIALMGERLRVSRCYLFEHNHLTDTMDNTIEWCAPGITPQISTLQHISGDSIPWWTYMMKRGENIIFRDIEDIPDEPTRALLRRQDILSVEAVPLFVAGEYYGFIGFDDCGQHREWPDDDLGILLAIARIITGVIERERTKNKLGEQMQELQRWHDITLGREKRVLELKAEINQLLKESEKAPRYKET